MEGIRDGYQFFAKSAGVTIPVSARYSSWDKWVGDIEGEIAKTEANLLSLSQSRKSPQILAGDVAEYWHAGTFNINSALSRSSGPRASVPRSNVYASADVRMGTTSHQLKYNADPNVSVRELTRTISQDARAGSPSAQALIDSGHVSPDQLKYQAMDSMVVAADKLADARAILDRRIAEESALIPGQVERYRTVRDRLTDRVADGNGNASTPLTHEDAVKMASEIKNHRLDLVSRGLSPEQLISLETIARDSLAAGVDAAKLSAALGAAPQVIEAARLMVTEGELDDIGLARGMGEAAVTGYARGFLTGTAAAAITDSARAGHLGIPKRLIMPDVIAAVVSFVIDVILDSIRSATGNMTRAELADSIGMNALIMTCGLVANGAKKSVRLVMAQIPVVGYLLGNFAGEAVGAILWSTVQRATVAARVERGLPVFEPCKGGSVVSTDALDFAGITAFDGDPLGRKPYGQLSSGQSTGADFDRIGIAQLRKGVFEVGLGVNGFTWDDLR